MSLQPGTLKLAGGVGALLVCGGAGVTVAVDQHPASAPLRPPVSEASTSQPAATPASLVIPPSAVCSGSSDAAGAAGTDPQLAAIVGELQQAPTAQARRQILAGLPADERQQVTALLRRRAAGGAAANRRKGGPSCRGGSAVSGGDGGAATIAPSVSDAGPSVSPLTTTYVS